MPSLKFSDLDVFGLRTGGLAGPAAGKFAGAWLSCFMVMARGNIPAILDRQHVLVATVCGIVGAVVTVLLLLQMDRTVDSVARQATLSAAATFIGDIFAHPPHFPPQWAEPSLTAAIAAAIAVTAWYGRLLWKSLRGRYGAASPRSAGSSPR
jgi:hypothetical protein